MPVLPYTPNDAEALPGTIGITNKLLAAMLERITEESILNGFRNVILMGDHGGGQPQVYEEVAKKLDRRYRPNGIRVFYCDQVRSEEHTSELQSRPHLVCRLLLEKKKKFQ